jgi:hypothetical protein
VSVVIERLWVSVPSPRHNTDDALSQLVCKARGLIEDTIIGLTLGQKKYAKICGRDAFSKRGGKVVFIPLMRRKSILQLGFFLANQIPLLLQASLYRTTAACGRRDVNKASVLVI